MKHGDIPPDLAILLDVAELITYTKWTLHYINRLDHAEVKGMNAIFRARGRVLKEIEAGKFKPSSLSDAPPDPVTLLED